MRILRRVLLETGAGDWLLGAMERLTGLALVEVTELRATKVRLAVGEHNGARLS